MNRFLSLLIFAFLLNSCNDGDLKVVSLDFSTGTVSDCNKDVNKFYLFTSTDKRSLVLQIPQTYFNNVISVDGKPTVVEIGGSNKFMYTEYVNNVDSNQLCPSSGLPSNTNSAVKAWTALGGVVNITTTSKKSDPDSNGATRITGYNHKIVIRNIAFNTGDGEQKNDSISMGNYFTAASTVTDFSQNDLNQCSGLYFKISGTQAIILKANPTLFDKTQLGVAQTQVIDGTINSVKLQVYLPDLKGTTLNTANFCDDLQPTSLSLNEEWIADNGVKAISGEIEVTASQVASDYIYTIVLKNVTLRRKDNLDFQLGKIYLFGKYVVKQ